jgi:pyridoxal phosphate enzyme (YggS family)
MSNIGIRLKDLASSIEQACKNADRDPAEVNLLAVSKTQDVAAIAQALDAGLSNFGENYLQEAVAKVEAYPEACWHFIGAIQSNKTRIIANNFDWVHSVSSTKIARRLSEQRAPDRPLLNVLLQVNVSGEESKSGIAPGQAEELVESMTTFGGIRLRGLMTIPEATKDDGLIRARFSKLRTLRDDIRDKLKLADFDQLSMGMTNDFPIAIEQGATWIRIGTAIFGPRKPHHVNNIEPSTG